MGFWERLGASHTVLALSFARMGDGIGNTILFIVIPLYISKIPAPNFPFPETVRAGILISLFGFVAGAAQPFTGALVDRLNRRKPFVLAGLLVLAGATISYTFTNTYTATLYLRALQGFGLALTLPATLAILADTTQKQSRGGSMGIFSTFRVASLGIGPLLGGVIHDHFGFNATFLTAAAFILIGALLVQLWVGDVCAACSPGEQKKYKIFDRSLISPPILALGFGSFVMASSISMITPLEQQLNAKLAQTATVFGFAFSALLLSRIAVQIPIGHLSDERGRKNLIVWGLVILAAALVPMGFVTKSWQLIALRGLQGIASAGIAAPTFALAGDLAKAGGEGRQMSIVTMGFGFGIATGALVSGFLAVFFLALPFLVMAGVTGLAAWTVFHHVKETVVRSAAKASGEAGGAGG
jgi:MFS family permease